MLLIYKQGKEVSVRTYSLIILSYVFMSFGACKKHNQMFELPEATRTGANTVGFIVNEYVWRPYIKCESFSDPCGKSHVVINTPQLSFSLGRNWRGKDSNLSISTFDNASISSVGEKIDSIRVTFLAESFSGSGDQGYYNRVLPGSNFRVTRFDPGGQVIAGEFHLVLGARNFQPDTVILKSGRFDFKFQACLCD
jgi:hypothetical protein